MPPKRGILVRFQSGGPLLDIKMRYDICNSAQTSMFCLCLNVQAADYDPLKLPIDACNVAPQVVLCPS